MATEALPDRLRETVALFDGSGTPMTTTEAADFLDLGRRSTYNRLERLVERGELETKKVGASARVWWRPVASATAGRSDRDSEPPAAAESLIDDVLDRAEVGVFVLDADFDVAWINDATERYFGLDRARVLGRDKRRLVEEHIADTVEDPTAFEEAVLATYEDNTYSERFDCHVTPGEDREERWLEHRSKPIASGAYAGGRVELYYDVSARRRSERARQNYRASLELLVDTVDEYAIFTLDPEGYVETWNAGAERITGYAESEIVGEHVSTFYTEADVEAGQPRADLEAAAEEEAVVSDGVRVRRDGSHCRARVTVSAFEGEAGDPQGYVKIIRDVTDQRERERRLRRERARSDRRYRTLFESIDQGHCIVEVEYDDDGEAVDYRFLETNPAFEDLTGIVDAEGRSMREIEPDHEQHWFDAYGEVARTGETVRFEAQAEALMGGWYDVYAFPFGEDDDTVAVLFDDVTERKERERELEEYRHWTQTLIENFPAGAVALVDEEFRYVTFAGTPEGDTSVTRTDLQGAPVRDVLPPEIAEVVVPRYEDALAGEASEFVDTVDDRVYQFHFAPVRDDDGDVFAATAMSQDVTERIEREEALRDAKLQLEAATEAGAVGTWEWHVDEDRFVAGPSLAKTFGVDPEAAREGVSIDRFVEAIHEDDLDEVERRLEESMSACGEYEAEYRVRNADGETRWVVARGHVNCDDDGNPTTFPGALTDITELKRAERELERQSEQLAALNSLHEVFQDITDAVIERSTREEIETAVCEGLAAVEPFSFAWIGEVNPATQTLSLRTEAGVEGYLDGTTVSVDPDDERSRGPGGRAFLTREVQVARDVPADLEYGPWRDHVDAHGVRSIAGVPIVYDDRVYGVLAVYSARPGAFAAVEQRLLGQLGEVVGHAIAAVERKRALMSDEVTELEFRIDDVFGAAGVDGSFGGRISLDRAVPASGEEFLVYGTATEEAWPGLAALVDAIPHWTDISRIGEAWEESTRFELTVDQPPMLTVVATRGGYVETALIEEGDCRLVIHLPPSGEVGAVSAAVTESYPTAELLAQRQLSRSGDPAVGFARLLHEELTDRQRAALESALYSGFFEWPRESTGEEIAAALGVSPPTFHQHLRKAERKIVASMLSAEV